jgi:glycerol-3-phosphate acyltransferase PlsY
MSWRQFIMVLNTMSIILLTLTAYAAGSLPTGKIIGAFYGVDIQKRGSGNIGFANVRRVLGWPAGLATLTVDIAKGFLPTLLALQFTSATQAFFIGLVAIGGHIYPVWLSFRGGKGIATGLGVAACLFPIAATIGCAVYVLASIRRLPSSTASLLGLFATAAAVIAGQPEAWWQASLLVMIASWTLRHNITGTVPNYELDTADA